MQPGWIEIARGASRSRHELTGGALSVGGPGSDVELAGVQGTLVFRAAPPSVAHAGRGEPPTLHGRALSAGGLADGDRLEWGGLVLVFHAPPLLEELELAETSSDEPRALRRLRAGATAEAGLADPQAVRRWQDAVRRGEFDPDRAAAELLAGRSLGASELEARSASLLRDFVMGAGARGPRAAARRARHAARTGLAVVISQTLAILVYTLVLAVIAVLVRHKWGVSFDALVDRVLGR